MLIIYCGDLREGETSRMRLEALERIGHDVEGLDVGVQMRGVRRFASKAIRRAGFAPDWANINRRLLACAYRRDADVIWIDKGLTISPKTLRLIRSHCPKTRLVHYSPDDMSGRHNRTWRYVRGIHLYHLQVTTKSFCLPELFAEGAQDVLFLNNAFCPATHFPVKLSVGRRSELGGPVGFIGTFEPERAKSIWLLAQNDIPVRVWGNGWRTWARDHRHPRLHVESQSIRGHEYSKAICSFDINLGFLRKINRDLQTTRSIEIPACGGFLLAERTREHQQLFREGLEAEFFGDPEELVQKCRYYLDHPEEGRKIGLAGYQRCLMSSYSYDAHVASVIRRVTDADLVKSAELRTDSLCFTR